MSNAMYGTCGILKSLLFTEENRLLSFSPPKAHNSENFVDMFPDLSKLQVEEFVDGTMINLFWDTNHDDWEITTRRKVGANNYYYTYTNNYHQPTFRSMFYDTAKQCELNIDQLDRNYSYSFVLSIPIFFRLSITISAVLKTEFLYFGFALIDGWLKSSNNSFRNLSLCFSMYSNVFILNVISIFYFQFML